MNYWLKSIYAHGNKNFQSLQKNKVIIQPHQKKLEY